jgi:hypothetical protein
MERKYRPSRLPRRHGREQLSPHLRDYIVSVNKPASTVSPPKEERERRRRRQNCTHAEKEKREHGPVSHPDPVTRGLRPGLSSFSLSLSFTFEALVTRSYWKDEVRPRIPGCSPTRRLPAALDRSCDSVRAAEEMYQEGPAGAQ